MKFPVTVVTLVVFMILAAAATRRIVTAQTEKTQWDGVYSAEQAERGAGLYAENCADCHGLTLSGGGSAPPLAGGEFNANWNDLTVGDLFERIRRAMPPDNPTIMTRPQKADVVAFILSKGSFPAGDSELPTQAEVLRTIRFLATKPGE
jgi:mono/diheme cytochrome c family protein